MKGKFHSLESKMSNDVVDFSSSWWTIWDFLEKNSGV
jgi:hypothetical protein